MMLIHSCELESSSSSHGRDAGIMFPYPNPSAIIVIPISWGIGFPPCFVSLVLYLLSVVFFRKNSFLQYLSPL